MKNNNFGKIALALAAIVLVTGCAQPNGDGGPMPVAATRSIASVDNNESSNSAPQLSTDDSGTYVQMAAPASKAEVYAAINGSQTPAIRAAAAVATSELPYLTPGAVSAPTVVPGYYSSTVVPATEAQQTDRIKAARVKALAEMQAGSAALAGEPASKKNPALADLGTQITALSALNASFLSTNDQMLLQANIAVLTDLKRHLVGDI